MSVRAVVDARRVVRGRVLALALVLRDALCNASNASSIHSYRNTILLGFECHPHVRDLGSAKSSVLGCNEAHVVCT